MSELSPGTCMSNLKSVALNVLNWSDWPVRCAQAHTQTHIERKQYLRHLLRSIGGDNKVFDSNIVLIASIVTDVENSDRYKLTGIQDYLFVILSILQWLRNNTQSVLFYKVKRQHWLGEVDCQFTF